jgi:hypothetical protein
MMKTISLLLGLTLATLLVVAGCGGGDPEDRMFELEIQGQALVQGDDVLKVKQNDVVTIVVAADTHISFHLHGYDIEQEAEPGEPTTLLFTANATGSFPFTMHLKTEDHEEEGVHDEEPEGEHEEGEEDDIELGRLVVEPR